MINGIYFGLPYYTYGILVLIAFLAGIWLFRRNARQLSLAVPDLVDLSLVISISGLIGARAAYILLFPEQFSTIRDYLAIHEGGLVFYGSLIGAVIATAIYCQATGYSFRKLVDLIAPAAALGHAIGRLGCINNNCCYGAVTTTYSIYRLPGDPPGQFRHPTQIYESLFLLVLLFVLNRLLRICYAGTSTKSGLVAGIYLAAYSFFRFLIEYIRGDSRGGFYTAYNLSPSQITAVILLLCSAACIAYAVKYPIANRGKTDEQS
ncbi:MAG: prolipoprotein diacylglyceryl transferase [Candidatus Riflebacteria bacterium HGW-Riflebacteria-1]|jgi:phosphatidylglycerol:prolipoprotein diacylglycerol transferase|nr:MAG: prolipoprotein diacylglyceryl transferase [Candidatus Riflebacteria bacterium HGW-Riflebacteria-1]